MVPSAAPAVVSPTGGLSHPALPKQDRKVHRDKIESRSGRKLSQQVRLDLQTATKVSNQLVNPE